MNLLVGFYNEATAARTEEFIECLRRNAANIHISREPRRLGNDLGARFYSLFGERITAGRVEFISVQGRVKDKVLDVVVRRCVVKAMRNVRILFRDVIVVNSISIGKLRGRLSVAVAIIQVLIQVTRFLRLRLIFEIINIIAVIVARRTVLTAARFKHPPREWFPPARKWQS